MSLNFERVFIHQDVAEGEVAERFFSHFPHKTHVVKEGPPDLYKGPLSAEQFSKSKKQVFVTKFKGSFFKRCPGYQKGLACCNYFVLNLGFQCDMDCSYCYLQSFINSNYLTVYTNIHEALDELRSYSKTFQNQPLRVGTGEIMDSLSLDPITLHSRKLIEFFNEFPHWKLEFKTKSDQVDQFLDCEHGGNTLVSWSVNPSYIVDKEEHGTASLEKRLEAARKCRDKGFPLSFHIDPMIWHPHWKENYARLIDHIVNSFSPSEVDILSVGALRFQPHQKHIMRERFGMRSHVTQAETFLGKDGKLRYDQGLREEMFQFIRQKLKNHSLEWKIFMCMETPETWNQVFHHSPHREKPLKKYFKPLNQISF